jgi:hypothetical protein
MAKSNKHKQTITTTRTGADLVPLLLDIIPRLENYPDAPESRRVEKVLHLLSEIRDDRSKIANAQTLLGLRKALDRYQWVNHVAFTLEGYRVISTIAGAAHVTKEEQWEQSAVSYLLNLAPHLELGRWPLIRPCEYAGCRRWFFAARRNTQKFCVRGVCQQKHHESDPEKLAMKRERVSKLYYAAKERDRKAKEGVGFGRRSKTSTNLRALRSLTPRNKAR